MTTRIARKPGSQSGVRKRHPDPRLFFWVAMSLIDELCDRWSHRDYTDRTVQRGSSNMIVRGLRLRVQALLNS